LISGAMYAYFKTNMGLAMRATGDNEQMIRALGVEVGWMVYIRSGIGERLVALSGLRLVVQFSRICQTFRWASHVVTGLASVITRRITGRLRVRSGC